MYIQDGGTLAQVCGGSGLIEYAGAGVLKQESCVPTPTPTIVPSAVPTANPSQSPSSAPSAAPTSNPTSAPTPYPDITILPPELAMAATKPKISYASFYLVNMDSAEIHWQVWLNATNGTHCSFEPSNGTISEISTTKTGGSQVTMLFLERRVSREPLSPNVSSAPFRRFP